jgi:hypothetical protein
MSSRLVVQTQLNHTFDFSVTRRNKKRSLQVCRLLQKKAERLDPALLADEIGDDRDIKPLTLIGAVSPVPEKEPNDWHTQSAETKSEEGQHESQNVECHIRRDGLHSMELDERL